MTGYRRFLLDMHIPDWDDAFLSAYDPEANAAAWSAAGVESAMLYCLSHVGLALWPTRAGAPHGALRGRDFVDEALRACRKYGLEATAYYSAIFNNRAWQDHPGWRIVPSAPPEQGSFMGARYGHVCPNNLQYRSFVLAQIGELMEGYRFDGFFFDMTFWPAICLCPSCRDRHLSESGREIPERVDWLSPDWCAFQSARERWMTEFALLLSAEVKKYGHDVPVSHNAAILPLNWTRGQDFDHVGASDFLAGDFYGDGIEQRLASGLMTGLSRTQPAEFMTSRTTHLSDHVRSKSPARMRLQALTALASGAAIRIIDAIDPSGTVDSGFCGQLGELFRSLAPLGEFLGGNPVEDIAVYVSDRSKMSFGESGMSIGDPGTRSGPMPHMDAARGAVRALQRAHLTAGIVTRKALSRLGDYRLLILPDLLRMDEEEMEAIRSYVLGGGRLYASRFTSLSLAEGRRLSDFGLADIFGCSAGIPEAGHCGGDPSLAGKLAYIQPKDIDLTVALAPQTLLSHPLNGCDTPGIIPLRVNPERGSSRVLATLNLPYAWPDEGSAEDRRWASIHSSPPWTDTGLPMVVENEAGAGRTIYSAADLEAVDHAAHERFFLALIRRLLDGSERFVSDAHPCVRASVFHQPEKLRYVLFFLNGQENEPIIPIEEFGFSLMLPPGFQAATLLSVPEMRELGFSCDRTVRVGSRVSARINRLELGRVLVLEYRTPENTLSP